MTTAAERPAWAQTPTVAPPRASTWFETGNAPGSRALAATVAALGPAVYAMVVGYGLAAAVAVTIIAATRLVDLLPIRHWSHRAAWWVATAAIVDAEGLGHLYGIWVIATLVLADWAVRRRPPLPGLPTSAESALPAAVLTAVAAYQVHGHPHEHRHFVITAMAFVVTLVSGRFGSQVTSAGRWVATKAAAAAGLVLFAALGVVVVVIPWVAQRIFVLDPVAARATPGWMARGRGEVLPDRPWTTDAAPVRRTIGQRVRWAVAVPLTLALVAGAWWQWGERATNEVRQATGSLPASLADLDWWPEYSEELDWAFDGIGGATNPDRYPPLLDVSGTYLNIDGGTRVTWTPPPCGCRRIRVWVYGGSAVFGWGQRDDHTIPSALAQYAWDHELALDIVNRGVPADMSWQEADRLEWDLAVEEPPDLVVVYDGANDLRAADDRNDSPNLGLLPDWPIQWPARGPDVLVDRNWLAREIFGRPPAGSARTATTVPPKLGPDELGRTVVASYERGRLGAQGAGTIRDVPIVWFWQPDRLSRPDVDGEPQSDPALEATQRTARSAAIAALPPDVRDLSDVFARSDEAVFFDDIHTNERGASIVAERLFAELRPELESIATSAR